jgi:hypothetical protein
LGIVVKTPSFSDLFSANNSHRLFNLSTIFYKGREARRIEQIPESLSCDSGSPALAFWCVLPYGERLFNVLMVY